MRVTSMRPNATVILRRALRARRSNVVTGGGAAVPVLGHGRSPAVILPKKCIGVERKNSPAKEVDGVREGRRGASSGETAYGQRARRRQ